MSSSGSESCVKFTQNGRETTCCYFEISVSDPILARSRCGATDEKCFFSDNEIEKGSVRVYPGKLQQITTTFVEIPVHDGTTVKTLIREALNKFGLRDHNIDDYR